MLDTGKDNRSPAAPARTSENSLGLKGFNQVGTEEGHLEILKPQGDPAHRRKTVALLSVVVVLLGVIAALAFSRSHLSFLPENEPQQHGFGPSSGNDAPAASDQ